MILRTYIFAKKSETYQQYISDYSEIFLKSVCKNCNTENQIVIHRDGNLIYYAYVHKNHKLEVYGLCIVCGELCLNVQYLYDYLKLCIEQQAQKGIIFSYDEKGEIRKNIDNIAKEPAEIDNLFRQIKQHLDKKSSFWEPLPPEDLSIPLNSRIVLFFNEDENNKIIDAIKHYHNIYITHENTIPSSFSQIVARLNTENKKLYLANSSLKNDIAKLRNKQRNILWVSILSVVVIVMGIVLYIKVINPREVTKYQTGDFIYYGPLNNKKPYGEGVAFYPPDDKDGRRYYIGYFIDGERQDSAAMLYYQNGDYYYGSMDGDNFSKGIFYSNSDKSHFEGTFVNNKPYEGVWYYHKEGYRVKAGKNQ